MSIDKFVLSDLVIVFRIESNIIFGHRKQSIHIYSIPILCYDVPTYALFIYVHNIFYFIEY